MVNRSNIHYSKINQKRNRKKVYTTSSGTTKNETTLVANSALHFKVALGTLDIGAQLNSMLKTK